MDRDKIATLIRKILEEGAPSNLNSREAIWLAEEIIKRGEGEKLAKEWAKRRAKGEPLAYILESQPFHNINLKINNSVLVPRPETEELIEIALKSVAKKSNGLALDLGTGSGALALALANALTSWKVIGTELSLSAFNLAKENAKNLSLEERVTFYQGSWFSPLTKEVAFDLIVTNPPYVGTEEKIDRGATFEPALALFAGKDGLNAYREILPEVKKFLKPDGIFLGECSPLQADALCELALRNGLSHPKILLDSQGRKRFLFAGVKETLFALQ